MLCFSSKCVTKENFSLTMLRRPILHLHLLIDSHMYWPRVTRSNEILVYSVLEHVNTTGMYTIS